MRGIAVQAAQGGALSAEGDPATKTPDIAPSETMPAIHSSVLAWADYDPDSRALRLTFRSGRTNTLRGVPAGHYTGLMNAGSPGAYFNTYLRGRY